MCGISEAPFVVNVRVCVAVMAPIDKDTNIIASINKNIRAIAPIYLRAALGQADQVGQVVGNVNIEPASKYKISD